MIWYDMIWYDMKNSDVLGSLTVNKTIPYRAYAINKINHQ